VCVLLTFLSEADAYLVTHLMLEQSRANRWYTTQSLLLPLLPGALARPSTVDRWPLTTIVPRYLCLTNRTLTLFLHTFRSLIAKCLPDVSARMRPRTISANVCLYTTEVLLTWRAQT
jgi:hypothetical protein